MLVVLFKGVSGCVVVFFGGVSSTTSEVSALSGVPGWVSKELSETVDTLI